MRIEIKKRWSNGESGWEWSRDACCYIKQDFDQPPKEICLGERYAHAHYGQDSYGVRWVGSTSDNWHGFHFEDFGLALRWVSKADHKEYQQFLWSSKEEYNNFIISFLEKNQ